MQPSIPKSTWSVGAGVLFIIVVTTLVDLLLHAAKVYAPWGEPMSQGDAVIASSYRLLIGIAGGFLTAWLAPRRPLKHALILGAVGVVLGTLGAAATWGKGLGPDWYAISLPILAVPQCWLGGRIYELRCRPQAA